MKAGLRGIQTSIANGPSEYLLEVENQLWREYFDILQQEEEFRSIKSRYNWLCKEIEIQVFPHLGFDQEEEE